jgi:effector-binding domain-containing protein
MRKNITLIAIIALGVMLVQCGGRKEQARAPVFAGEIETLAERTVVSLERTGSYDNIGKALEELSAQLAAEHLNPNGVPFAIYYNEPGSVPEESLSWAVCIPVESGITLSTQSPIKIVTIPEAVFASTVHTGGYEHIAENYDRLEDWIDEQGLMISGPAMEFFISNKDVPAESMRTKVGFVVEPAADSIGEGDEDYEFEEETEPESING